MSERSVAFVPVASGYFQSPELFARGRTVDTGLLAEALVFYDQALVQVDITSFLLTIGSAIGEWKPKMFGNWYNREIANLLKHDEKRKHSR